MPTIEEARTIIADLAKIEGEEIFAREVLAGAWDHRRDVQAALAGTFTPRELSPRIAAPSKTTYRVWTNRDHPGDAVKINAKSAFDARMQLAALLGIPVGHVMARLAEDGA